MRFLSVPNFEKWQHYKDRTPPWIKLHRDLLRDYDFNLLADATKAHLVLIWLLASQLENQIPDDAAFVQRMIGATLKPDLKLLVQKGFLIPVASCQQDASTPLATCTTLSPIRETEGETEKEEERETHTPRARRVSLDGLSVDHIAEWLARKRVQGKYISHDEHFVLEQFKDYCKSKGKRYEDYIAAYRGAFEWDRCQPRRAPTLRPGRHEARFERDDRDPAARAYDAGEDIIALRRAERELARSSASREPGGAGRADPAPLPDLREPEGLR